MYTVHKNGLEGKNWKIVKELNSKSKNTVWTNQNNTDQGQYTTGRCIISDRVCQPDG